MISVFTLIVSFLTSFLFTAYLLEQPQIGDVNYGLKSTADSLTAFVSVFTAGMSSTFIRFRKKFANEEKAVVSSFNVITSCLAFITLLFGVVLIVLTANNLILDPNDGVYTEQQVHDFLIILVVSISYVALSIVLGNNKWFLESDKQIVFVRLVNLAVVAAYPIIGTVCVFFGGDMTLVTVIYSACYLAGFLCYLIARIKQSKNFSFLQYRYAKKEIIKEVLVFSFFVVISVCVETFNHSVDKLILTKVFTASLTTIYQLSMTLNQVLLSLSDIIYAPYLPYLVDDIQEKRTDKVQRTYDKVNLFLLIMSFALLSGFAACGKEFVYLWLGDGKELVYYFTITIFLTWPLYSMVKFSTSLQRLYGKHVKSSLLYLASFLLHVVITFSLIQFIDAWACIIGTAASMLFLGISFIFYNRKYLGLSQKKYLLSLLKLSIVSVVSIAASLLFNYVLESIGLGSLVLFLAEGVFNVVVFLAAFSVLFFNNVKRVVLLIFSDSLSLKERGERSIYGKLKQVCLRKRSFINSAFPYVLICYFLLNFSLYYLGGISAISSFVGSAAFQLAVKFCSYLVIAVYICLVIIANSIKLNWRPILPFAVVAVSSLIAVISVPKNMSFLSVNQFGWLVETRITLGIADLLIGEIGTFVDLGMMFAFLYVFPKVFVRDSITPFLKFIVCFTLVECLYSAIFQYEDILYFFRSALGEQGFNGYSTNLSGTFSSKNGFGFLLFQGTVAALYLAFFEKKRRALYLLALLVITCINFFSLCKTSLVAALVIFVVLAVYAMIRQRKTRKRLFAVLVILCFLSIVAFVMMFVPPLRNVPLINKVVSKIEELFLTSGSATTSARFWIWEKACSLLHGPYFLIGYGSGSSPYLLRAATNLSSQTFHNAVLETLCSYGVIGLALYVFGLCKGLKNCLAREHNRYLFVILVLTFVSTLLYGMMENVYVFMTSSCTAFCTSVVLSTSSSSYRVKRKAFIGTYEIEI